VFIIAFIGSARTRCSYKLYETVKRPFVCSIIRPQPRRAAGLLLNAVREEISIDSGGDRRPPAVAPQHGAQQQTRAVSRLQLT